MTSRHVETMTSRHVETMTSRHTELRRCRNVETMTSLQVSTSREDRIVVVDFTRMSEFLPTSRDDRIYISCEYSPIHVSKPYIIQRQV